MKKYVTFVKDEETSRQVQKALFEAGFSWTSGDTKTMFEKFKFLVVNWNSNGYFSVRSTIEELNSVPSPIEFIDSSNIIANPFQLDGAKQPGKMIEVDGKEYSTSTIKAALQEYVK